MSKFLITILILAVGTCAWAPWLKIDEAQSIMDAKVYQLQQKYPTLCEIYVNKDSLHKVLFGYSEEVSYDCTKTDVTYGVLKSSDFVLITFYKQILNMPLHTVKR